MPHSGDGRTKKTREALQAALQALIRELPYDKLTVSAVARRAGVGRTTFYSQFSTVDDLFRSRLDELWSDLASSLPGGTGPNAVWELAEGFLVHSARYHGDFRALRGTHGETLLLVSIRKNLTNLFHRALGDGKPRESALVVAHLVGSLMALAAMPVVDETATTGVDLALRFRRLNEPGVAAVLGR
jgi:AcrR family transcriptional regulator